MTARAMGRMDVVHRARWSAKKLAGVLSKRRSARLLTFVVGPVEPYLRHSQDGKIRTQTQHAEGLHHFSLSDSESVAVKISLCFHQQNAAPFST